MKISDVKRQYLIPIAVISILLSIYGCGTVGTERISNFSEAAKSVTGSVSDTYTSVETAYGDASLLTLLASPDKPLDSEVKTWMPVSARNLRIEILHGIAAYAEGLATLASGKEIEDFDKSVVALANTLTGVQNNQVKTTFKLSSENVGIFATAVNAIGNWLIRTKTAKAVKQEIIAMDPTISTVSNILADEIGILKFDDNGNVSEESRGLRADLWQHFGTQAIALTKLYQKAEPGNIVLRKQLLNDFRSVCRNRLIADSAILSTIKALKQLAKTHASLKDAYDTQKVSVATEIRNLDAEAKRLRDFYTLLMGKKGE